MKYVCKDTGEIVHTYEDYLKTRHWALFRRMIADRRGWVCEKCGKKIEPACGNGNFLVEIVRRRLNRCRTPQEAHRAVSSVYGIDILPDNVNESRERVKALVSDMFPGVDLSVVDRNIICGDSLEIMKKWEED